MSLVPNYVEFAVGMVGYMQPLLVINKRLFTIDHLLQASFANSHQWNMHPI